MKYFGTDGIRKTADKFFVDDLAYKTGIALTKLKNKKVKVAIAMDTRLSGPKIEKELIEAIKREGSSVVRLGIVPTPALAYMTVKLGCDYGIMISASHNPPEYNGIKIFGCNGYKLDETEESQIETYIDSVSVDRELVFLGSEEIVDGRAAFIKHLYDEINYSLKGYKIKIDCGYGASSKLAKELFEKLGAKVVSICDEYKGELINVDCGSTNINNLHIDESYDIGFSFDGDVDRVIAVDNKNNIIDGDAFLYVIAKYLQKHDRLKKDIVVGTIMTNMALVNQLKEENNIEVIRTDVGDKYIQQSMLKNGYSLGGEQSGHIILDGEVKTGDGIFAAATLVKALNDLDIKVNDLNKMFVPYPQTIVNIKTENKEVIKNKEVLKSVKEAEKLLLGVGRVNLRASGTEPKIRIMVESKDSSLVDRAINIVKNKIEEILK